MVTDAPPKPRLQGALLDSCAPRGWWYHASTRDCPQREAVFPGDSTVANGQVCPGHPPAPACGSDSEPLGIVASVMKMGGWEVLDIATNRQATIDNWNTPRDMAGHCGGIRLSINRPSDADLRGIIEVCQRELDRRAEDADLLARLPQGESGDGPQRYTSMYDFQCPQCFIVSGFFGPDPGDAPTCCGGEPMHARAMNVPVGDLPEPPSGGSGDGPRVRCRWCRVEFPDHAQWAGHNPCPSMAPSGGSEEAAAKGVVKLTANEPMDPKDYRFAPCGCVFSARDWQQCQLHATAGDLLAAAELAHDFSELATPAFVAKWGSVSGGGKVRRLAAAIAKARGMPTPSSGASQTRPGYSTELRGLGLPCMERPESVPCVCCGGSGTHQDREGNDPNAREYVCDCCAESGMEGALPIAREEVPLDVLRDFIERQLRLNLPTTLLQDGIRSVAEDVARNLVTGYRVSRRQ